MKAVPTPELPIEVEIELDEEALFEAPAESEFRIRTSGGPTRAFRPPQELLTAATGTDDSGVTHRVVIFKR